MKTEFVSSTDKLVALIIGVVEKDHNIRQFACLWQVLKAASITTSHIRLRHIMATTLNAVGNSCQIDLNIPGPNVNQIDAKSSLPCIRHDSQVILS